MSTAEPIRSKKDLTALKKFYLEVQPNLRNYVLINTGVNTALRISDILSLRWGDVYNFEQQCFYSHLSLTEKKTGKKTCIIINQSLFASLQQYFYSQKAVQPEDYIFYSASPKAPLSRSQAFRIIQHASQSLNLPKHISCHSLRKTFGYHAWQAGVNPALLMTIYNHSSFAVTKRYLGIEQEDKDQIFLNLNL